MADVKVSRALVERVREAPFNWDTGEAHIEEGDRQALVSLAAAVLAAEEGGAVQQALSSIDGERLQLGEANTEDDAFLSGAQSAILAIRSHLDTEGGGAT